MSTGLSMASNLEQRLRDVQRHLASEFTGRFSPDEIERVAQEALDLLKDARVDDFVPLLVARVTRARLLALRSG